jgi:hypothetical protein
MLDLLFRQDHGEEIMTTYTKRAIARLALFKKCMREWDTKKGGK